MQTGVKSFGCENKITQELPIQSWKRIRPSVVSASKSGAVSPIFIDCPFYFIGLEKILFNPAAKVNITAPLTFVFLTSDLCPLFPTPFEWQRPDLHSAPAVPQSHRPTRKSSPVRDQRPEN